VLIQQPNLRLVELLLFRDGGKSLQVLGKTCGKSGGKSEQDGGKSCGKSGSTEQGSGKSGGFSNKGYESSYGGGYSKQDGYNSGSSGSSKNDGGKIFHNLGYDFSDHIGHGSVN
jgi:hypothetical protein